MSVTFQRLKADHLPAFRTLLLPFWERTWDEAFADRFLRWRFLERGAGETILAFDEDRCVGMLDASMRPYIVEGETILVREPADWFTLPEYRGIGLKPMWELMESSEPLVSIAGSEMTRALLPRLRWQPLPDAINYHLALSSGVIAEPVIRWRCPPAAAKVLIWLGHKLSLRVRRPQTQTPRMEGATVHRLDPSSPLPDIRTPANEYALAALFDEWDARWLAAAPASMGEFVWLRFSLDRETVALSSSRLFQNGLVREARLLHLQASEVSTALYGWIITETARYLYRLGAQSIRCRASCPTVGTALKQAHFVEQSPSPVYWWAKSRSVPAGAIHVTFSRGDDGIRPYPL